MFTRYGHVNQVFVKVGDKVKLGQKIATNGTGNGQWLAHLHRDHPKFIPNGNFGFYNIGWPLAKTKETFNDPNLYPKALGDLYDHLGYDWLQLATYSTGKCYHPGLDENGRGADFDDPIYCVAEGVVVHVANDGKAKNGGWGKLIVIEEIKINEEEPMKFTEKMDTLYQRVVGEIAGENVNDNEQDKLADGVNKKLDELKKIKNQIATEAATESVTEAPVREVIKEVIVEKRVAPEELSLGELVSLILGKLLKR